MTQFKTQFYALNGRLKQFFTGFYRFTFDALFCYLVEQPIHAFTEQMKYCLFFQCFDMFVEQTKEIMYQKWNMALLADLIWTCGHHVLFCNIFIIGPDSVGVYSLFVIGPDSVGVYSLFVSFVTLFVIVPDSVGGYRPIRSQ